MKKLFWIIPVVIILLFVILNPGMNQFKEFTGILTPTHHLKRISNYLVFSIYEKENVYGNDEEYLGILMNFIDITKKQKSSSEINERAIVDTVKAAVDTAIIK